ncbi:MAG: DUF2231 domain-containing protein [Rhodothermia bacterium]
MGPLFEYEIPLLHPLLVHFPIALILVGAAIVVAWAANPRPLWYRVSVLAFAGGAAAAVAAYLTGEAAEDAARDVPIVEEIVHIHENLAIYTLAATIVTLVALVVTQPRLLSGRDSGDQVSAPAPTIRWIVAAVALTAAVLVAWTSHLGGIMVWGVAR